MLEPAVRPGGLAPSSGAAKGRKPFEAKSFQDLLGEAAVGNTGQASADSEGQEAAQQGDLLLGLSGLGRVENVSLRQALIEAGQRGNAG